MNSSPRKRLPSSRCRANRHSLSKSSMPPNASARPPRSLTPLYTDFKYTSPLLATQRPEDILYVIPTLRIDLRLNHPLFLKDLPATPTTAEGEEIPTSAFEKPHIENVYTSFPALKPLA